MMVKQIILSLLIISMSGCQKQENGAVVNALEVGDCLDQVLSPYVLKVAAIEGETIFFYNLGEMGKKIYKRTKSELLTGKSPFQKSLCP